MVSTRDLCLNSKLPPNTQLPLPPTLLHTFKKPTTASLRMSKQLKTLKHVITTLSINELNLNPAIWFGSTHRIFLLPVLRRNWTGNASAHTKLLNVSDYKLTNSLCLLLCVTSTMYSMSLFLTPSKLPRWHLADLHRLRHSTSRIAKNTLKSKISLTPSASIAITTTSSNGRVSLTQRIHGNLSSIFLHAGLSGNFIVATLGNQESLAVSFLLLFCWNNGFLCVSLDYCFGMQQHHHLL